MASLSPDTTDVRAPSQQAHTWTHPATCLLGRCALKLLSWLPMHDNIPAHQQTLRLNPSWLPTPAGTPGPPLLPASSMQPAAQLHRFSW